MKLLYQTHSPFARKVLVFAYETGLKGRLTVEHHETSPTNPDPDVVASNPLGKVPVLLRAGLTPLFDSSVICEYLDTLHDGPSLFPLDAERRWDALRLQALAQDLAQAGIGLRWETERRPAHLRYPKLQAGYERKIVESYDWLEREVSWGEPLNIGQIALATTLDWLTFRKLPSFRAHPELTRWFDAFAERPSMQATPLCGETQD